MGEPVYTFSLDEVLAYPENHRWPDDDCIQVQLERTSSTTEADLESTAVDFCLAAVGVLAEPGHRWWKQLSIHITAFGTPWTDSIYTVNERVGDFSRLYSPFELNACAIVLWKAKAFGIETPMYQINFPDIQQYAPDRWQVLDDTGIDGPNTPLRQITFSWSFDGLGTPPPSARD
jgi:hypothetical protein